MTKTVIEELRKKGIKEDQIMGFGGDLDRARLETVMKSYLKEHDLQDLHVIGGHGELVVPVLGEHREKVKGKRKEIREKVRQYAQGMISKLGGTAYGPGELVSDLTESIALDKKKLHHVSQYDKEKDLCVTWPCSIGENGIEERRELDLEDDEKEELGKAIKELKEIEKRRDSAPLSSHIAAHTKDATWEEG